MEFKFERITPEIAKKYLETNTRNRSVNKANLGRIVGAIKNGEYISESPTPICFDDEGHLIDGQHRLMAIVMANTPATMFVARDVPKNAVFDRGTARTVIDSLYMRGEIEKQYSSKQIGAVCKLYLSILLDKSVQLVSENEIAELIKKKGETINKVILASSNGKTAGISRRASLQTAALIDFNKFHDMNIIDRFFECSNTGFMNCAEDSPAIIIRNCILKGELNRTRNNSKIFVYKCMHALYDMRNGTVRQKSYTDIKPIYEIKDGDLF